MFLIRKTSEELNKLCKKYNTNRLWSWSRINTYLNSPYEYLLKYVLKKKEDRQDCIYTVTGGMSHDIMERFYSKEIKLEDMIVEFEDAWNIANIAELKFDRNGKKKNEKIKNKYCECLNHFFKNHSIIKHNVDIERFVVSKIGDNVFQGYIDICYKDDEGRFNILDWKTSSIYKGKKAENECGQLIVYAMALNQMGVSYEKIKICWNFLKYVSVQCEQANGKLTIREIERNEIGSKLQSSVKMWLKRLGYEEKLLEYLDLLHQTNNIKCLPEDVQKKYVISDCVVYVDITEELLNKWQAKIVDTVNEITEKEELYNISKDEKIFWENEEAVKAQSYYFATLCSYSANLHKPYKQYLEKLNDKKEEKEDLYSAVGSEISEGDLIWLEQL